MWQDSFSQCTLLPASLAHSQRWDEKIFVRKNEILFVHQQKASASFNPHRWRTSDAINSALDELSQQPEFQFSPLAEQRCNAKPRKARCLLADVSTLTTG